MSEDQTQCVLRTHRLCDSDRVVSYRTAPAQDEGCFCKRITHVEMMGEATLGSELRTHRARTVARWAEIERLTTRHRENLERGDTRW